MDDYKAYFKHLDYLREERSIHVDDFCEDICSSRQYRRYLNNENVISQLRLSKFYNKLGLSNFEFISSYYASSTNDYRLLADFYYSLFGKIDKDIDNQYAILSKRSFSTLENQKFFQLCNIIYQKNKNQITAFYALDKLGRIINYPACTEKLSYNFIEIATIQKMGIIEIEIGNYDILENLYRIIMRDGFIYLTNTNEMLMPNICQSVSISFGMKGDIQKSLEVALKGIEFSLKGYNHRSLAKLYYLAALSLDKLGRKIESYSYARKCISTCVSTNNEILYNHYISAFKREQNYSFPGLEFEQK